MSNGAYDVWPGEKWSLDRKAWPALRIDVGHARRISLRKTIRALQKEEMCREVCVRRRSGWNMEHSSKWTRGEMWKIHGRLLKRSSLEAVSLG